jgi:hypothetical protein
MQFGIQQVPGMDKGFFCYGVSIIFLSTQHGGADATTVVIQDLTSNKVMDKI